MFPRKFFPYALVACSLAATLASNTSAQTPQLRAIQASQVDYNEISCSPDEFEIIAEAAPENIQPAKPVPASAILKFDRFQQLISSAIDQRLGSRYRWGGTGPYGFDCSGFVWSIFQSAGIDFERGSARNLWGRLEAPAPDERYKFGTLVFFSNLAHVGVVADEHGFYHASRHHGVVYSPFNDYWVSRIDGFRKVPLITARISD
jgi:cell wall-associated NlpC family hydrolase